MASENLNVGTAANANNGDTLRAAFIKVKKMFAEIYGQTYDEQGDLSGTDFKVDASRMETTNTPASGLDGYVMTYDHSTGGFTFEEYFNGDITRVQGGSGLSGDTAWTDPSDLLIMCWSPKPTGDCEGDACNTSSIIQHSKKVAIHNFTTTDFIWGIKFTKFKM
jgi:hypothetical protein